MDQLVAMVEGVKALGMESCMTLGMLDDTQVFRLRDAGLDYYNHNIDTSERYYPEVITTRTFADRIDTLKPGEKRPGSRHVPAGSSAWVTMTATGWTCW